MITQWSKFRDFINSKEIGYIFTRKELGNVLFKSVWGGQGTADGYRSYLQKAKFLSRIGRGKYKLEEHIPAELTMGALFALLRGDNLTYFESIQKQKDFKILKEEYLQQRRKVILPLLEELTKTALVFANSDIKLFGIVNHLPSYVRFLEQELKKETNPTKAWKRKTGN